jgi:hypothetical protein
MNTSQNRIAWVGHTTMLPAAFRGAFYIAMNLPLQFPQPATYIFFPFVQQPQYSQLHKVHYNPNDQKFHCGGFYTHNNANNDKTTFVVAPEQAVINNCGGAVQGNILQIFQQPNLISLPSMWVPIKGHSNKWHQVQGNFCPADCDDTPLYLPSNSNCGN